MDDALTRHELEKTVRKMFDAKGHERCGANKVESGENEIDKAFFPWGSETSSQGRETKGSLDER